MEAAKISPPLAAHLNQSPGDNWLDVIVELARQDPAEASHAGREARINARRQAFEQQAGPVTDLIRSLGGEVTGKAWINGSLRARLNRNMISTLSTQPEVIRL